MEININMVFDVQKEVNLSQILSSKGQPIHMSLDLPNSKNFTCSRDGMLLQMLYIHTSNRSSCCLDIFVRSISLTVTHYAQKHMQIKSSKWPASIDPKCIYTAPKYYVFVREAILMMSFMFICCLLLQLLPNKHNYPDRRGLSTQLPTCPCLQGFNTRHVGESIQQVQLLTKESQRVFNLHPNYILRSSRKNNNRDIGFVSQGFLRMH